MSITDGTLRDKAGTVITEPTGPVVLMREELRGPVMIALKSMFYMITHKYDIFTYMQKRTLRGQVAQNAILWMLEK
jgi:hypothetical protein